MQIIIPMSGVGRRFVDAGYEKPKPFIRVHGRPIIEYVVNLFPGEEKFFFILNNEHLENTEAGKILRELKPDAEIIGIDKHKKGPVYAISRMYEKINDNEGVIVSYCDFNMAWDYEQFKREIISRDCDASVPAYTGFHPHLLKPGNLYAGMLVDDSGMMIDIKEKFRFTENPEDSHHSPGVYYFRYGREMKKYFNELMEKDINLGGEYYASLPFYLYLRDQKRVYAPLCRHFMQWGTPEDLEEYLAWAGLFLNDDDLTDIPVLRRKNIKLPYSAESEEYRRCYDYWREYFDSNTDSR